MPFESNLIVSCFPFTAELDEAYGWNGYAEECSKYDMPMVSQIANDLESNNLELYLDVSVPSVRAKAKSIFHDYFFDPIPLRNTASRICSCNKY